MIKDDIDKSINNNNNRIMIKNDIDKSINIIVICITRGTMS